MGNPFRNWPSNPFLWGLKATGKVAGAALKPVVRNTAGAAWWAAKGTPGLLNVTAQRAIGVGSWLTGAVLKHPRITAMAGLGALGAYGLAQTGTSVRSDMSEDQMAYLAESGGMPSTGFAPGMGATRQALIDSTDGLSLGLHAGRHS